MTHTSKIHAWPSRNAVIALLAVVCLLTGCSAAPVRCTSPVDNPAYHYLLGMTALEGGHFDIAMDCFDRAVYCNDRYSPGYFGRALVMAKKSREQGDGVHRSVHVQGMRDNLQRGKKHADTPVDEFLYHLAQIRTDVVLQEEGWLKSAEDSFFAASRLKIDDGQLPFYKGKEAADYFMAQAYLEVHDLRKARERFKAVLAAGRDRKWDNAAERAWKKVDKIVRATSGITLGEVGSKISLQDSVSRGDMAALLKHELKLDMLLAGMAGDGMAPKALKAEAVPADILSHPFRNEILAALAWKVRGLESRLDERSRTMLFSPSESISRAEMALLLDDVLAKLDSLERPDTRIPGQERRVQLSDVRPTSPFFRAVANVTRRGIMEEEGTGEFRPNDVVDGAEAILALRMLKQIVEIK